VRTQAPTLSEELVGLAQALQPMNAVGRSAAVWRVDDGVELLYAAPDAPSALISSAGQRLGEGETAFDVGGAPGERGIVYVCRVGGERVAYGLFIHGAGQPHLGTTIEGLIGMAEVSIGKRVTEMSRTEKQSVVRFLDDRGAFLIRRAVEDVADRLGVTRFTIYNYLDREEG
jgi:hypothetical protein